MITHKITLDYQQLAACRQVLHVKQYDYMSRTVEITLTNGGAEFTIPNEYTEARLAFRKPDGHGGVYSQIDNEDAFEFGSNRHTLTMILHPQAMTCAGTVECELQLIGTDVRLSTFRWQLNVEAAANGEGENDPSQDYYSVPGIHGLTEIASLSNDDEVAVYDISAGTTKKAKVNKLGGGTSDHSQLSNRDAANSHPMSAILGLLAALAAKYEKPATGIPWQDLKSDVVTSLGKADTAYQKPSGGIPASDLASAVLAKLAAANPAETASAVLSKLQVGDTVYSIPQGGSGAEVITVTVSGIVTSMSASQIAAAHAAGNIVQLDYGNGIIAQLVMLGQDVADFATIASVNGVASVCVAEITGSAYQSAVIPLGVVPTASSVSITDTAGYYTSGNVEGALAEVGAQLNGLETALDSINDTLEGAL